MKRKKTDVLIKELQKENTFYNFCIENEVEFMEVNFSKYLENLCKDKETVPEKVIKAAGIDRTYGHQLFNGTRKPSRDKVIQLAFGFKLNVEETQELLRVAGKCVLYPRIKRDAAILFALSKGKSIMEAQELLFSLKTSLLGDYNG